MGRIGMCRFAGLSAVTALVALTCVASAGAASTPFGCRASLARVSLGSSTILEPLVANKATAPCTTLSDGLNSLSIPSAGKLILSAGPAAVYTFDSSSQPTITGTVAPGATALSTVNGVTIPTSGGSIVIVGPVSTQASYACMNGSVMAASSSTLTALYVNGQKISLAPDQGETIKLGGGSYVAINEKLQTATSLAERLLDVHLSDGDDIVVGEAKVTQVRADPCASSNSNGNSNTTPPAINPCPPGSMLNIAAQLCEIVLPNGTVIIISRPFQGPTGGEVLALSVARKLYRSPCLYGKGPNYAIVGTNKADRITGTSRSERILALAGDDRVAGQGGDDCIDGGPGDDRIWGGNGNDRVFGGPGDDRISVQNGDAYVDGGSGNDKIFLGNGNDRVFGGPGNDRISVGRGNDYINGGTGNDTISAGDGNDTAIGGPGNDWIYVGNGIDHVYGGSGNDRIYSPSENGYIDCGSGRDLAYINTFAMPYARRHGCETVRQLRPHKL
ncbi:MAG: choice-of-anchor P family protein [Solirubrobacteraceae bacterium]